MPSTAAFDIALLATGGTIAGQAALAQDNIGYRAGTLDAPSLLAGLPLPDGARVHAQTVAQLDSKDMDGPTWQALLAACTRWLEQPQLRGLVVTHGTDTLEETAYLLHRVLAPTKPVVLTSAMRPASALSPDGPQNLADALRLAADERARGVCVMFGGEVIAGAELRKLHGYRVQAFGSGDAGPLALMEESQLRELRPWPAEPAHAAAPRLLALDAASWPWVEVVTSRADADARHVQALVAAGVKGIIVAGTGNGTVHARLLQALQHAQHQGVVVRRASRCILGGVVSSEGAAAADSLPDCGALTPYQARIELMLDLISSP